MRDNRKLFTKDENPRYLRIYDYGGTHLDRYTIVFTGNYKGRDGICRYIACGDSPDVYYQHMESEDIIDRPEHSHLGKAITFDELPPAIRSRIMEEYIDIWNYKKGRRGNE